MACSNPWPSLDQYLSFHITMVAIATPCLTFLQETSLPQCVSWLYFHCKIQRINLKLNTLRTLELANVSQLFTSTWKHYHTQWNPNIIQWFMFETIMQYGIQCLESVKQGIIPRCAKFHICPKIIKGVLFPERNKYYFSQFLPLLLLKWLKRSQHVHCIPQAYIKCIYWYCIMKWKFSW